MDQEPIEIIDLENMKQVTVVNKEEILAESINRNIKITLLAEIVIVLITILIMSYAHNSEIKAQNETIKQLAELQSQNNAELQEVKEQLIGISENKAEIDVLRYDVSRLKLTEEKIKEYEYNIEMTALEKIEDKEEWFIEYKRITEEYKEYIDPPETIYDNFTQDEINLMCRMVQTEIGCGDFEAKVRVADVVWNRMEDEDWPNTIYEIIKPGQFATGKTSFTESTRLAVEYSFLFPDITGGALAFHSNATSPRFGKYYFLFFDGWHNFFSKKENVKE